MRIIICILLFFPVMLAKAADKKFPVSDIPDSLKVKAHAVFRQDDRQFIINNLRSTTLKRHYAVTILNGNGDAYSTFTADYDKLHTISNIEGALYDKDGNLVKKLKVKEIQDVSGVSDNNLDDDSRIKAHNFLYHSYPYTVEYSYETNYSHTFYFPAWIPLTGENISVQRSTFSVQYAADYQLRYHSLNLATKPEETKTGNLTTLRWQIKEVSPIKIPEQFASWKNVVPIVFLAPGDFQLDGKSGNMSNWKDFGSFIYQLIEGKDALPEQMKRKVAELTKGLSSEKEKIKVLYSYLQQNTRYISVQLGVGGWVPFDASYVANRGYGDCKALTNYMHTLLKEAGINSYYTLVRAGSDALSRNWVMPEFSSNQFNHVILCVPGNNDTTWLECTSQTLAPGYMSGFTANRKALLISKEGGFLVSTPSYGLAENVQSRLTKATIADNGLANIQINTTYNGTKQDFLFSLIRSAPSQKVKEYLSRSIALPTFDVDRFDYEVKDSSLPFLHETLEITAPNYATVTGKRIFLTPNILTKFPRNISNDDKRQIDFSFEDTYKDSDVAEITLPKGYKIESSVKPVELKTDFGYYKMECKVQDGKVIYKREFEQFKATKPVADQEQVVSFYQKVYSADRARIVLVKEQE